NRSEDVSSSFPLLTPDIEAAFPERVTRDAGGQLVAIDQRPISFARQNSSRLRFGLNISGQLSSGQEQEEQGQQGGFAGGFPPIAGSAAGGPGGRFDPERAAAMRERLCAEGQ